MLITDHINGFGANPLIGPNEDVLGPRFPDMSAVYDPQLTQILKATATRLGIPMRKGVYIGLHGPSTRRQRRSGRAAGSAPTRSGRPRCPRLSPCGTPVSVLDHRADHDQEQERHDEQRAPSSRPKSMGNGRHTAAVGLLSGVPGRRRKRNRQ